MIGLPNAVINDRIIITGTTSAAPFHIAIVGQQQSKTLMMSPNVDGYFNLLYTKYQIQYTRCCLGGKVQRKESKKSKS